MPPASPGGHAPSRPVRVIPSDSSLAHSGVRVTSRRTQTGRATTGTERREPEATRAGRLQTVTRTERGTGPAASSESQDDGRSEARSGWADEERRTAHLTGDDKAAGASGPVRPEKEGPPAETGPRDGAIS
jgi:hypothetical protein